MKLNFSNIGIINNANMEIGKLTLLCGKNNTSKTYLTYSIYGLLKYLSEGEFTLTDLKKYFNEAIEKYTVDIPISEIYNSLEEAIKIYSSSLDSILAVNNLNNASIKLTNLKTLINEDHSFKITGRIRLHPKLVYLIQYKKEQKRDYINISFISSDNSDNDSEEEPNYLKSQLLSTIEHQFKIILIREMIKEIPNEVFISSVERTGIAIFKEELEGLSDNEFFFSFRKETKNETKNILKGSYPKAVIDNISAVKKYHYLYEADHQSRLSREADFILKYFYSIINGEYKTDSKTKSIKYIPTRYNVIPESGKQLSLIESSSSIRSLLDIGIYLKYFAAKGQTLIIDEPEMNLHPHNQRKIARLIAMLVNYGINILLTTHSDFITREISFLIMMKDSNRNNKRRPLENPIIKSEGYMASQLLDANNVRVYSSNYDMDTKSVVIKSESVSSEDGFTIPTFDNTVEKMNEIYNILL